MSKFRSYINIFQFDTVLPGSGDTISFRPVTTGMIKKLLLYETSNDNDSIEDALDEVITECVVSPEDFDVKKLYLQDRFYLLVDIRKATRGAIYNFQTTCASCGSQTQQVLDIGKLVVTKLNKGSNTLKPLLIPEKKKVPVKRPKMVEKKNGVQEVTIIEIPTIPSVGQWDVVEVDKNLSVRLSLITRGMQVEAFDIFDKCHVGEEKISELVKAVELSSLIQALSIVSIISPDGEETDLPLEDKMFFLDNIQQDGLEKISKWFDKNDFGLDFSFDVSCSQCKYKERKAVPVENFFY